jgi:integrase/recombinase XerD
MKEWSLFHANIRVIQVLLSALQAAALYARVATKTIRALTSPLEHLGLTLRLAR